MEIETVQVADLVDAPYNPRQISQEALAGLGASIERWGMVEPVVLNKRTGHIVGGHQRVAALRAAGKETTKAVIVDLEEGEERALNIALNNPHITGEWTEDATAILEELQIELGEDLAGLRLDVLQEDLSELFKLTEEGGVDTNSEWKGMPEFEHKDLRSVQHITVHFPTHEDAVAFGELIGQPVTEATRFMWHPPQEVVSEQDKRY